MNQSKSPYCSHSTNHFINKSCRVIFKAYRQAATLSTNQTCSCIQAQVHILSITFLTSFSDPIKALPACPFALPLASALSFLSFLFS